ncbi:MAG: alpha/beta hydrolase [Chitinophagaceae bacterium]|nr:MAG: alpha/beta hydrolase [Chitinophagaceae bacterium]
MSQGIRKRNNVKITGSGDQPMLFAHGFGCDQAMWGSVIPFFEKDYRIITFDYVGHGKSDMSGYNPHRYSSLHGYAQDVLDIITELDLNKVIFVGHSVSCMIGMLAAIQSPEHFSELIMVGPSPHYLNDSGYHGGFERTEILELLEGMSANYRGWSGAMAPAIMGNADRPELGAELTASFCSTDPAVARQFAEVTFLSDNREDLRYSPVPALILQCADDIIAPGSVGKYLSEHLPDSSIVFLSATGHCPHMSAPEETAAAINDYLNTRR